MVSKTSGNALAVPTSAETIQKGKSRETPVWGWAFIIGCLILPFLSFGEAIPAVIGYLGALGCYWFSRDESEPATTRKRRCWLTAIMTWTVYGAYIFAMARYFEL